MGREREQRARRADEHDRERAARGQVLAEEGAREQRGRDDLEVEPERDRARRRARERGEQQHRRERAAEDHDAREPREVRAALREGREALAQRHRRQRGGGAQVEQSGERGGRELRQRAACTAVSPRRTRRRPRARRASGVRALAQAGSGRWQRLHARQRTRACRRASQRIGEPALGHRLALAPATLRPSARAAAGRAAPRRGLARPHALRRAALRHAPCTTGGGRCRMQTTVKEFMSGDPVSIAPGASALDAYEAMLRHGIRHLPVVAPDARVIGVLTADDLAAALALPAAAAARARGGRAARGARVVRGRDHDPRPADALPRRDARRGSGADGRGALRLPSDRRRIGSPRRPALGDGSAARARERAREREAARAGQAGRARRAGRAARAERARIARAARSLPRGRARALGRSRASGRWICPSAAPSSAR